MAMTAFQFHHCRPFLPSSTKSQPFASPRVSCMASHLSAKCRRDYTSVMIVPTGVGASIGGFAGDALPVARALSSVVDCLITHPNVLNAAMLYWPMQNVLYVEGYALDRFAEGSWALDPVHRNKVGLVLDNGIEEELRIRHLQAADATRASLGLPVVEYVVTDTPLEVEKWVDPKSGQSTGRIKHPDSLLRAVQTLIDRSQVNAIAVVARFPDDDLDDVDDYRQGMGIDVLAGVEAVISHLVVKEFQIPCAHAPAMRPLPMTLSLCPKSAAEEIGYTFLPCVLAGLSRAPQYLVKDSHYSEKGCLFASDVDSVLLPVDACGGDGALAFARSKQNKPLIITVEENETVLNSTPDKLGINTVRALLHFLDPDKFRSKDDFVQNYKNLSSFNENELANLHLELRPHILRRVIKDVEKSLPPKIERILRVEMSPLQKQYYKWILERNFHDLNKGVRGNQVSLLNIVVELKKCCNHPFLFESADHGYGGDSGVNDNSKLERIILSSGKLVILDKLLVRLHETKHRVLIFSQMVRMLDILAEYMSIRGFQFQRLDGSTKAELRQQAMDHFNAPGSDDFCFLLSTRAGGLGINLATADTVIIFDSDWNPQNDLQAMSRAHRIGQQEVVNIYRFVTSKSVEEDILERAKKKMVLDHLVIQKLNAEGRLEKKEAKKGSNFDKNELSAILRFGAEELFKEDRNEEESKKRLLSMDIDEILERAEKVEDEEAGGEEGHELLSAFKVANFCSAEDDGSFWSRWIKPEAVAQAEEALAPRAARNNKSYTEAKQSERSSKRKKKNSELLEPQERVQKRRKADHSAPSVPMIDGASAQVREWSQGNLSKRDALRFSRAVMKFGNMNQIDLIVAEVGGSVAAAPLDAQIELFDALIDGCKEAVDGGNLDPKGPLLDFFGVPVKANDLLNRVQQLQLLAKRISRYENPIAQFRVLMYLKPSNWSKGCGWNQIDDARFLLGIHYHGFGNWEKIRLDERLGLSKKIAPAELQHHETFLPRAPNLRDRANALLEMELAVVGGKNANVKVGRKASKKQKENIVNIPVSRSRIKKGKPSSASVSANASKNRPQKPQRAEQLVKEEGEMSDNEELREQFKEVKWMEWCEDVMVDEIKTLRRLQRLQTTSADLPKEKVLSKIRKYLQLIGRRIDQIVIEYEEELYRQDRMTTRLWNYVSTFSNLSGERLHQIYSKLKQEQEEEAGVGPSRLNGSASGPVDKDGDANCFPLTRHAERQRGYKNVNAYQVSESIQKGHDNGKFEAWKRRRRAEADTHPQFQPPLQRPMSNGARLMDPNSLGILGAAPSDNRPLRMRQTSFPPRQNYSSGIK